MALMSDFEPATGNGNIFSRWANAFWNGLVALGEAGARTEEIKYWQSLSDEQLAERGLTRDQIVRHVFRDRIAY
ncbi:MAG: DUF1127 domain-containing protein [Pseudomonadota bacterium]